MRGIRARGLRVFVGVLLLFAWAASGGTGHARAATLTVVLEGNLPNGSGYGNVVDEYFGQINCTNPPDTSCSSEYAFGDDVALRATAAPGWTHQGWDNCPLIDPPDVCNVPIRFRNLTVSAIFVDETPPETTITSGTPSGTVLQVWAHWYWASDDAGATFEYRFDSGPWTAYTNPANNQGFRTCPGRHTFELRAKDAVGNVDPTPATRAWNVPLPDLDGDCFQADIAVFRPSNGFWYVRNGPSIQWGMNGDVPVARDYDGNGSVDIAVWRPTGGVWYIYGGAATQWGLSTDVPVPADYDGDGDADIAVWRPSTGVWYIRNGATVQWGMNGDIPVPHDYDYDGDFDIAVFRPSNGFWYVLGGLTRQWGLSGDIPVPGYWTISCCYGATPAVFRPSNGFWHVIDYTRGSESWQWGMNGDVPIAGEFDGTWGTTGFLNYNRSDPLVFRPSTGNWHHQFIPNEPIQWGMNGDIPIYK
jgi:hypothetical protein